MEGNSRSLLRKFCLESTVLGLKYLYLYPDRISRCFWLTNLCAVLSLAVLLSTLLFARYTEMPTRVTIESQYEPIQSLPFPAITICSPNQVTASFVEHLNKTLVDGNVTIDLERILPKLLGFYELVTDIRTKDLHQLQSLLDENRYTVLDIMTASPQRCQDFLKLCYFEGAKTDCAELFAPVLTTHGLCCAFNNAYHLRNKRNARNPHFKARNVTQSGKVYGLTVVVDYNPEDALDNTILNAGATKVLYNDHTEFPADDESYLVQYGVESYHVIHAVYTYCSEDVKQNMPQWGRKCYLESERHLPFFGPYRRSDCDMACLLLAVHKACRCHLLYAPGTKLNLCRITSIPCIMDVRIRMRDWMKLSPCECPRDCEARQYNVDINLGNLDGLPHMITNVFSGLTFNQSTSAMYFYFQNSVYSKLKHEAVMSFISIFSNLGGVYGLCLGCSGISLLEILFYVYTATRNHIMRRMARRTVQHLN